MGGIALFGGTFDPLHIGHLRIAIESLESFFLEKVIFVPNKRPPHKNGAHFSIEDRIFFLKETLQAYSYFEYSLFEIKSTLPNYTYHTLRYFKNEYSDKKLYFIMGEDSYWDLENWYKWRELLELSSFLVYPRKNSYDVLEEILASDKRGEFYCIKAPIIDISSTLIREKLSCGKSIDFLVPDKIKKSVVNRFKSG